MDVLTTLSCILFLISLAINSTDAVKFYRRESGNGQLGGIIAGSIFGAIVLILFIFALFPLCKTKCCKKAQRVHVTKTPNKNLQLFHWQTKKRDDDALKLADDDDTHNKISIVATGSQQKAKLTKNRRTLSTPIIRMTLSEDTVKTAKEKRKKSNRIGTVQAVSKVYGKVKTKKKKRMLEAMEAENNTNGIPDTPPPAYEELEYRPNIPPPSYSSCKSPYPPTAFDYGY